MTAVDVNSVFASMIGTLTTILTTNIPLVLGIVAALIGLAFVVKYVKKHLVGGK